MGHKLASGIKAKIHKTIGYKTRTGCIWNLPKSILEHLNSYRLFTICLFTMKYQVLCAVDLTHKISFFKSVGQPGTPEPCDVCEPNVHSTGMARNPCSTETKP